MAKLLGNRLRWDGTLPDPRSTPGVKDRQAAARDIARMAPELATMQEQVFANGQVGRDTRVLLVLQGMDASGKDGTVKHVVGMVNPAGCRITSFGVPTRTELEHDFLWRVTNALPRAGELGVFNRSHYEDVLVARVHELVPRAVWSRRFARINTWERRLTESGTKVLKVFLHISKDEQKARLLERLRDPTKHWKVGAHDIDERHLWEAYQEAYLAALTRCSEAAPWYVVPADRKWYRDWAVSQLLLESLREMDLGWPRPSGIDLKAQMRRLLAE